MALPFYQYWIAGLTRTRCRPIVIVKPP